MKKIICIVTVSLLLIDFLFFPTDALNASRQGLTLWFHQILPTLLPFSILSYIVLQSGLFSFKPLRYQRISTEEWYVIVCGFLFGFPIGSKLTNDLYQQGHLTKKRAQILCCFTNNLSPVYVTAVLSEVLHRKPDPGFYLLLYGIPLLYGILRLRLDKVSTNKQKNTASRFQINMQIVDAGIINGFETLIKICGYIMMFSILTNMLRVIPWKNTQIPLLLTGCLEVTNGMAMLGSAELNGNMQYLLALFFLSMNGISGIFQTASILSRTDLSMKHYCRQKILLVLLALSGGYLLLLVR